MERNGDGGAIKNLTAGAVTVTPCEFLLRDPTPDLGSLWRSSTNH